MTGRPTPAGAVVAALPFAGLADCPCPSGAGRPACRNEALPLPDGGVRLARVNDAARGNGAVSLF